MPFSIPQITVDGNSKIIAMDWTYTNDEGSLKQTHQLLKPYGDVPLDNIDQAAAVEILELQLRITTEELDKSIHAQEQQNAYKEECQMYAQDDTGSFSLIEEPEEPTTLPIEHPNTEVIKDELLNPITQDLTGTDSESSLQSALSAIQALQAKVEQLESAQA